MSSQWQISNRGNSGSAASVSRSAPGGASAGNEQLRLVGLTATLGGPTAGTDQVVVRDGPTGTGTIIFTADLSIVANGFAAIQMSPLDLRASPGNALTIEFVNGVTGNREDVNGQGDYIPQGTAYGVS